MFIYSVEIEGLAYARHWLSVAKHLPVPLENVQQHKSWTSKSAYSAVLQSSHTQGAVGYREYVNQIFPLLDKGKLS